MMAGRLRLVTTVLLLVFAHAANAASVTWTFQGILRDDLSANPVPPALGSLGVGVGAPVSGSLQFNTDAANIDPPGAVSYYENAVERVDLTVGSWSLSCALGSCPTAALSNFLVVSNDTTTNDPGQFFFVDVNESTGTAGQASFALELSKRGTTLWPGNAMLVTPPPLSQLDPYGRDDTTIWGFGTDIVIFAAPGLQFRVQLTSLVPEPAVSGLLVLTLAAAVLRRGGRSPSSPCA